jgi:predicted Mrr-cat superfamily restriction endonuclease
LLRNLHIVDEPYQSPYEAQKPTQGVFGVVLLEKIWRVAPGRGGEWWDECRENGCIVIGWNEAAEKAPNNDFRQLSRDELKDLFKQVYRGKGGSGGWSQVWRFVHEIQPGDIIVAKKKKKKKWDK